MNENVYVSLGSNQGDIYSYLCQARRAMAALPDTVEVQASSLYKTSAWGKTDQADFLNQVVQLRTSLAPRELLAALQEIEIKLGRHRLQHWGPRTIDLDILLYGQMIIQERELIIPHPYMKQRLFVLVPLAEITEGLVFPDGESLEEVLYRLRARDGESQVNKA